MRHSTLQVKRARFVWMAFATLMLATLACGFEGGAFGSTPVPVDTLPPGAQGRSPGETPAPAAEPLELPESILITAPLPGQGVRGPIHIEGMSDPAFEQQLYVLVRDAQGTVIGTGHPLIEAPAGQRGKFSADVALPGYLPQQPGRVVVYAISPRDGGIVHSTSVGVQLNGTAQPSVTAIDPSAVEAITIAEPQPGAQVHGTVKVSAWTMLVPDIVVEVRDANNETVGRLTLKLDQTKGLPAPVMVDVPIDVTSAQPGRVLVSAPHPGDGQPEHLSSVEVNLNP